MDNNKKNKKKVSVKANTGINNKLILKKSFVIKKSDEILCLVPDSLLFPTFNLTIVTQVKVFIIILKGAISKNQRVKKRGKH